MEPLSPYLRPPSIAPGHPWLKDYSFTTIHFTTNDQKGATAQIGIETYKGTVQLSGFVDSPKAVDKAVEITKSVKGVKSVKNNLIIKQLERRRSLSVQRVFKFSNL
jgi:hypothetical protein